MGPRWTIDELLEKYRCGNRAAPASARVFHVRPFAANQILVVVPDGHSPETLAGAIATFNQLPSQGIIIGEKAGRFAGQSYHDGAGQGGVIDQMIGLELRRVMQGVSEVHAAFGVGIDDLHRLADAEGRMILGDALHYASELKPDHLIDYATLTGAVVRSEEHTSELQSQSNIVCS